MRGDAAPAFLHLNPLPAEGGSLVLPETDAHYVTRVCRAREGDRLTATDGLGARATLVLTRTGKDVEARVERIERIARPSPVRLLCGAPESGRADWLVEKLAELGVATFQPVACVRGGWDRAAAKRGRWDRLASAALRQSLGSHVMEIHEPVPLAEALRLWPEATGRWVADPDGAPPGPWGPPPEGGRIGAVGPASGFDPGELEALRAAGYAPVRLGDRRLRTETAAVALAAVWAAGPA